MDTDLEKLRRFCLIAALTLLTYVVAGLNLQATGDIKPFGIPFNVKRSDLLPVGIAIACFLGMIRFIYYAFFLSRSPYRRRRDLMEKIQSSILYKDDSLARRLYFGRSISTTSAIENQEALTAFLAAFPRFLGARVRLEDRPRKDASTTLPFVVVPFRVRAAAIFEDLDYSAPVWVSVFALYLFVRPYLKMSFPRVGKYL